MTQLKRFISITALVLLSIYAQAQTVKTQDVDTITVNGCKFVIETPFDWYSVKVQDGIVDDTSWNYFAKTFQQNEFGASVIGIQFVRRSDDVITDKEEKKMKRNVTFSNIMLGEFLVYKAVYKETTVRNCRTCGNNYMTVYSLPLNNKLLVNFVLQGYGSSTEITNRKSQFDEFCTTFLRVNLASINSLILWNGYNTMKKDTLKSGDIFPIVLRPSDSKQLINEDPTLNGFEGLYSPKIQGAKTIGKYGYSTLNVENSTLKVFTSFQRVEKVKKDTTTISGQISTMIDTSVKLGSNAYLGYSQHMPSELTLYTSKYTYLQDGSMLIVTVVVKSYGFYDQNMTNLYRHYCQEYATSILNLNKRLFVPIKVDLQTPKIEMFNKKESNIITPKIQPVLKPK
ncbi:MAG: hypothetical protein L6Q81_14595 [Bacteroidia bacterium]|nr:hypothetical protein [Bacteroidia bacterium]